MSKNWKNSLLSSGLPLEYETKRALEQKGCLTNFEYSYFKPNEFNIERQFSYDVDGTYIKGDHFLTLMVECKYRHPGTQWVFTPSTYGGEDEFEPNAFMHAVDHFVPQHFPFRVLFPRHLAPACSKGIEITDAGNNSKSITQATMQLAYAVAPQTADAVENQVLRSLVSDIVFYHVPVIVTTAQLFRLKENISIRDVMSANEVEEVATNESCLVLKYPIGIELRHYNHRVFQSLRERLTDQVLKSSLQTFTDDLDHLFDVLATYYCPQAIVVIKAESNDTWLDHLFTYTDELFSPSDVLLAEIETRTRRAKASVDRLLSRASPKE